MRFIKLFGLGRGRRSALRALITVGLVAVLLAGCGHVLSLIFLGDFALTYLSDSGGRWVSRSVVGDDATAYPADLVNEDLGKIVHTITPSDFTLFIPRVEFHSLQNTEAWVVVVAPFPERLEDEYYLADFVDGPTRIYPPRGRAGTMDMLQIQFQDTYTATNPDDARLDDVITFTVPPEYADVAAELLENQQAGGTYAMTGDTITVTDRRSLTSPLLPQGASSGQQSLFLAHGVETGVFNEGSGPDSPYTELSEFHTMPSAFLVAPLPEVFEVPLNAAGYNVDVFFDIQDTIVIWDRGTPDDSRDDVITLAPIYWDRFRVEATVIE